MKSKGSQSCNVSGRRQAGAAPETLTRSEVAKALGCSIPTVRRMEGATLHPTVDANGIHRFDPAEVIHALRERSLRAVAPSEEGERDARVFDMLDAGNGVREIVTSLRLPIELVLKLSAQWRDAGRGDLVIPPARRLELERCLGSAVDATRLTQQVRSLDAEHEQLRAEHEKLANQMGAIMDIIGELASRSADADGALRDLRSELGADQIERLDASFRYHRQKIAPAPCVAAELPPPNGADC